MAAFPPLAERVFVLTLAADAADLPARKEFVVVEERRLDGPFAYALDEPNLCVLDFAAWRLGEGPWEPEAEILKIDEAVRARVGLKPRGGHMVQPWARSADGPPRTFGRLTLRFSFAVAELPAAPVELLVETPHAFQIEVNSVRVTAGDGWFIDPCLRRVPIPAGALRVGGNHVELETLFSEALDLEAIYLAGDFGVVLDGRRATVGRLPERLEIGDVTTQGLPFYSGKISWRLPVAAARGIGEENRSARLSLEPVGCAALKLRHGDGSEELLPWAPFAAELRGTGDVTCEMYLTRRNTFGPLHEVPKEKPACGPNNFRTAGDGFSEEYQLFASGFASAPVVSIGVSSTGEGR